ncbi:MAG TPA: hypothetical protein VIL95_04055, partial [Bacillota bacterium]
MAALLISLLAAASAAITRAPAAEAAAARTVAVRGPGGLVGHALIFGGHAYLPAELLPQLGVSAPLEPAEWFAARSLLERAGFTVTWT